MNNANILKFRYFIYIYSFCFVVSTQVNYGQNIEVLKESKLDLKLQDKALFEHHLSIDPNNGNRLLLSGMFINTKDDSKYGNFVSVSTDGGGTWKHTQMLDVPEAADPWGIITQKGALLTTALGLDNLFVFRSINNGESWKQVADLGEYHDHQTMVLDAENNRIYIVSIKGKYIYVNYSEDDGVTFNNSNTYVFSNLSSNTLTPIVYNGKLVIPFITFGRPSINGKRRGGKYDNLETRPTWIISFEPEKGFGTPLFVSESCGLGFGVFAKDDSSKDFKDNFYYTCSNSKTNSIFFHYSNTKGVSWTPAMEIRKYGKQKRLDRNAFTGIPQVTVNNEGVIGMVWKDLNDDLNENCSNLHYAASLDGGKTFLTPKKVSSKLSCSKIEKNKWGAKRYPEGGDYLGFVSNKKGEFIVTWPDSRNGMSEYYTATIRVKN